MRFQDRNRRGTTLVDVIVSLGIIALLFGGIFLVYFSLIDSTVNVDARNSATAAMNQEVEIIRNLPYDKVGTVGGIPSGIIPQQQNIDVGNFTFSVKTTIRNIDDPFDGTLGGNPNDTAPADYKQISMEVDCMTCNRFSPILFTTLASPKNLESAGSDGSLFIYVFDSNADPLPGVSVHIINTSTTPAIDLTDTTNQSGVLQLVGVPTSIRSYQAYATKAGYSSDQTYPWGAALNPKPTNPHATVDTGSVAPITFYMDKVSQLTVRTTDVLCAPVSNQNFSLQGEWLIGKTPDVLKFSTTTKTGAGGTRLFSDMQWDTYHFSYGGAGYDLMGTNPLSPMSLKASSTADFRFTLAPSLPNSVSVTPVDSVSGSGIPGATAMLSKSGFTETKKAGHAIFGGTDWSGGNYDSQSGGVDANGTPGSLMLLPNASSTYNISTEEWLISKTIDVGSSTSAYYFLDWNPKTQSGPGSIKFQLAANNDNSIWNFVGPSGNAGDFYTASSTVFGLDGNRYIRYKVYLNTQSEDFTPQLDDINFEFNSICVPSVSVFWNELQAGSYNLLISAPGYLDATGTVSVGSGWQEIQIPMILQ
jgi:hypothetical protein